MKPHVICHMMVSLDGRIHPSRWTASPDGNRQARRVARDRGSLTHLVCRVPGLPVVAAILSLAAVSSCFSIQVLYGGPRRPDSEVAHVKGDRTIVVSMDGIPVEGTWSNDQAASNASEDGTEIVLRQSAMPREPDYLEILPGEHSMFAVMFTPLPGNLAMVSTHALPVCFRAYPGRFYQVRPEGSVPFVRNHWRPAVYDFKAEVFVDHECPKASPDLTHLAPPRSDCGQVAPVLSPPT